MQKTSKYSDELLRVADENIIDSKMISSKLYEIVDAVKNNIIGIVKLKEYTKSQSEIKDLDLEVSLYSKLMIYISNTPSFQEKIRKISIQNSSGDKNNEFISSEQLISLYKLELKK